MSITTSTTLSATPSQAQFAGWQAQLKLGFEARGQKTVLSQRQRLGPLAVQRPFYPEGAVCHVYLLHPPGGVAGGDELEVQVHTHPQSAALLTSPGAAKFYHSHHLPAQQRQHLSVADGACLEWLPQENIFFPGARVTLDMQVHLQGSARFIGWDIQCLGRPVIQERFTSGSLLFRSQIQRDGVPLLIERLSIQHPHDLDRPAGLNQHAVFGTLYATPADQPVMQTARECLNTEQQAQCGMTLLDGMLVARYLGPDTALAKACFEQIWQAVRPLIMQRDSCIPRIWNT